MLRVVAPPEPIVAPENIAGVTAGDTAVAGLIAAVTEEIDGPSGWLGRSLGPQTIEWTDWIGCRRTILPCRPIIKIESVVAVERDGTETTVDAGDYRLDGDCMVIAEGAAWVRCERHRILYKAGYNGTAGAADGEAQTGDVPERARQAIILSVQHLRSLQVESLYLKVDEVDGVGRKEFTLSEQASNIVEQTCERLLSTLRVYS
jgi:hypothetical protein